MDLRDGAPLPLPLPGCSALACGRGGEPPRGRPLWLGRFRDFQAAFYGAGSCSENSKVSWRSSEEWGSGSRTPCPQESGQPALPLPQVPGERVCGPGVLAARGAILARAANWLPTSIEPPQRWAQQAPNLALRARPPAVTRLGADTSSGVGPHGRPPARPLKMPLPAPCGGDRCSPALGHQGTSQEESYLELKHSGLWELGREPGSP